MVMQLMQTAGIRVEMDKTYRAQQVSNDLKTTIPHIRTIADTLTLPQRVTARAVELAGLQPGARQWRDFLDRVLLIIGVTLIAAGVAAFFAWNWTSMGRFLKFAVIEAGMITSVVLAWHKGLDSLSGKAGLFMAAFLTGILLAVYGQTYQTGADPYGLFLGWALLILAWAVVGRQAALWLLIWVLLNLSIILYWQQILFPQRFGLSELGQLFGPMVWLMTVLSDTWLALVIFLFNALALLVWERQALAGVTWLAGRMGPRLIMLFILLVSVSSTLMVIMSDMFSDRQILEYSLPVSLFVLAAVSLVYYRRSCHDLFMLAAVLLSGILIITALFVRLLSGGLDTFFLVALVLIGQLTWATVWLRNTAREWRRQA